MSPRSRELDSRGAAHASGIGGAVNGASVIRGASGVLSCDEGRSKGAYGESGESERGVEYVV